jgi:hypothetical protein
MFELYRDGLRDLQVPSFDDIQPLELLNFANVDALLLKLAGILALTVRRPQAEVYVQLRSASVVNAVFCAMHWCVGCQYSF